MFVVVRIEIDDDFEGGTPSAIETAGPFPTLDALYDWVIPNWGPDNPWMVSELTAP